MARRMILTLGGAVAGLLIATGAVTAGGWATITADPGNPPDPNAGEPVRLGFEVLQHGVTPVSWPAATVIVRNAESGETFSVPGAPEGPTGHYVAEVTFPSAGHWTWRVELTDLLVESQPITVTIPTKTGSLPPLSAAAIERLRTELRAEMRDEVARVDDRTTSLEIRASALERELGDAQPAGGEGGATPALIPLLFVAALLGGLVGAGMMAFLRGASATPKEIVTTYVPTTR